MAGIAKPDNIILIGSKKEMIDYEVIDSYCYNQGATGPYLFDGIYGSYSSNTGFDFDYSSDYIKIKINKPCNLYICLDSEYPNRTSKLIFNPDTYKAQEQLQSGTQWQLMIKNLKPNTYIIKGTGSTVFSEWFFEEIINPSEKIKNSVKNTIINNELIQKYLIPYDTVGDD